MKCNINPWQLKSVIIQTQSCWCKGKEQHEVMSHAASHKSATRRRLYSSALIGPNKPLCHSPAHDSRQLDGISIVHKLSSAPCRQRTTQWHHQCLGGILSKWHPETEVQAIIWTPQIWFVNSFKENQRMYWGIRFWYKLNNYNLTHE